MQADRDDRISTNEGSGRHSTQTLVTAIAVIILAGGAYLLMPGDSEEEAAEPAATPAMNEQPTLRPVTAPRPTPEESILAAPDIPQAETEEVASAEPEETPLAQNAETPPPPPTPEELDAQLREDVRAAGLSAPAPLGTAYAAPYLLDRGVSSLDQLARGLVPTRTSNMARPSGAFKTTQEGADYAVDTEGYRRYDKLVAAITALPVDTLASLFHDQRELIQDAYAALGYPADALDNTLIAALDNIIAAPTREQPPALVSKGALWAYADPQLENASDLHKQLLRTGPANTEALQQWAARLRDALLNY
ncbi:DUF3014 domain-containing protein [Congregibacter litoralis]|uniref:DUF3014 domain-containing protein n=1 Tax=Congregibacter litoralis KT71 TaxID=314285 RepID=A4AAG7_9GAMM|nr:DUF3014 domain-containing protein [Congregibacter litoralis]EAQ97044.1 hypothetical protein KT71_12315 [Congregibacter litoralis KT71]